MEDAFLNVILTQSAVDDLQEIVDYWTLREEPERGRQYVGDLIEMAEFKLCNLHRAKLGRLVKKTVLPGTREVAAFGIYRIIYRLDEPTLTTYILRYWHAHRDPTARSL